MSECKGLQNDTFIQKDLERKGCRDSKEHFTGRLEYES